MTQVDLAWIRTSCETELTSKDYYKIWRWQGGNSSDDIAQDKHRLIDQGSQV